MHLFSDPQNCYAGLSARAVPPFKSSFRKKNNRLSGWLELQTGMERNLFREMAVPIGDKQDAAFLNFSGFFFPMSANAEAWHSNGCLMKYSKVRSD